MQKYYNYINYIKFQKSQAVWLIMKKYMKKLWKIFL